MPSSHRAHSSPLLPDNIVVGTDNLAVVLRALYLMDPHLNFDRTVRQDGILWDWRLENPELAAETHLGCGTTAADKLWWTKLIMMGGGQQQNRVGPTVYRQQDRPPSTTKARKGRNSGV